MQYVGSPAQVAELCVTCACSACQHFHLRPKEHDYTKEGFERKASSSFTETLPEVQPLLLDLTAKTTTVSIASFKNASCCYMCNACSKKVERMVLKNTESTEFLHKKGN